MKKLYLLTTLLIFLLAVFPLAAEHPQLPTIVVEGESLRPGTLGLTPDSTGLKDTASLLERIPGANVNRNGALTGIASYRGMYGNRVNVKVDNFIWKEVGPNSMDPPLSHIPAPLTDSLTVYRGIAPVSSGLETIGGSMSAASKTGEFTDGEIESHGLASIGYSSVDHGRYGSIFTSLADDKHKIHFSGSQEQGNDYKFENNKSVDTSQYDRDAYALGYGYKRDGQLFDFKYSNNNTGHTGTPTLPMDIMYVRGGVASFAYNGDFESFKVKSAFHYQDMRHKMNNFTLRPVSSAPAGPLGVVNLFREVFTEVDGYAASLGVTIPALSGNLSVGVDVDQSNHDAVVRDPTNALFRIDAFNGAERDRYSGFVEWTGQLSDNFSLELGGRYNYVRSDSDDAIGRNPLFVQLSNNGVPGPLMNAMALNAAFNKSDRSIKDENLDIAGVLRHTLSENLEIVELLSPP